MAYNTTPIHGKIAVLRKNTTNVSFAADWSINVKVDSAEYSSLGDAWKSFGAGLAEWSGAITCHFVAGNTEQKALMDNIVAAAPGTVLTDVKFVLDATANQFNGSIILTSMAVKVDKGAYVDMSFNFQGTGALTLTSAGT